MSTSTILILIVLAIFVSFALVAPVAMNLPRFVGWKWLICPARKEFALIKVNPFRAALTADYGGPELTVRQCMLRRPEERCDEKCLELAKF